MRRSDIGPMGVVALVLVLLVQVTALAAVPAAAGRGAALVLAEVTGRVAVVAGDRGAGGAAGRVRRPGGRPDHGGRTACARPALLLLRRGGRRRGLAVGGAGLARCAGWPPRWPGCWPAACCSRTARRRLGGMTGDVFGAIIELSATAVLVAAAVLT